MHIKTKPTCQNGYYKKKKRQQRTSIGKDVDQRKPSFSVGGNVNWCSHCGNSIQFS